MDSLLHLFETEDRFIKATGSICFPCRFLSIGSIENDGLY